MLNMSNGRSSLRRHNLIALERAFREEVANDCSTRSTHTAVEKGPLLAPDSPRVVGGRTGSYVNGFLILGHGGLVLSLYGIVLLLCGLCGRDVGLIAVVARRERSGFVWLTMVPGLVAFIFLIGEVSRMW
jgi:hypothetical protein